MSRRIKEYAKVLLIPAAALVALILWIVPIWQARAYRARFDFNSLDASAKVQLEEDLIAAEDNARATLPQIIGGAVQLFGLYFTWKAVTIGNENLKVGQDNGRITKEGKLTQRFSKAVELLGSENLELRLGGIYSLERIARDSQKERFGEDALVRICPVAFKRGTGDPSRNEPNSRIESSLPVLLGGIADQPIREHHHYLL